MSQTTKATTATVVIKAHTLLVAKSIVLPISEEINPNPAKRITKTSNINQNGLIL